MRTFTRQIIWFLSGGILAIVVGTLLCDLWVGLHWWKDPVANWLSAHGFGSLTGKWGILWLHIPEYLLAAVSALLAGFSLRRQPMPALLLFGVGFVVLPCVVAHVGGFDARAFGLGIAFRAMAWSSISLVLVVVSGVLGHRLRIKYLSHEESIA